MPFDPPYWWTWELGLWPHARVRMRQRGLGEIDVRRMLEDATALGPDDEPGRWVATARHEGRVWEVVVEPDHDDRILWVVSAYPVT